MQTKKNKLLKFTSNFLLFLPFYSFCAQNIEKTSFDLGLECAAGQNIQQLNKKLGVEHPKLLALHISISFTYY